MAYLSENSKPLKVKYISTDETYNQVKVPTVETLILPFYFNQESIPNSDKIVQDINLFIGKIYDKSTIAILTSPYFASILLSNLENVHYKLWIAVKLEAPIKSLNSTFDIHHSALIVLTKYAGSLLHTKTRIAYTYCPSCNRTTKDYGGKKHLYHEYGTLMSDVWRDITVDIDHNPKNIINRLKDLFGIEQYEYLRVHDLRNKYPANSKKGQAYKHDYSNIKKSRELIANSKLINGDCIEELKKVPSDSIDFCFADPPYNLSKKYESWNDTKDIKDYFEWCDEWLKELARVLKPGRTLALLNIPQWCVRHFKYLNTILDFQDWIVWEALSVPVRMIMPSHYSVLCFSKGRPKMNDLKNINWKDKKFINTIKENYCSRIDCLRKRQFHKIEDKQIVTDLWWDIHRIKHNSRRVDHPTQLPPAFMYRLISLFTKESEVVLDPFNGSGTTSLTSAQLNRKYIGIELSEYYYKITLKRHKELEFGEDPFRKLENNIPKAKNSTVQRLEKQKYEVSKKVLQLEVRRIAKELKHMPTKDEVYKMSKYPSEYFEKYFINWGEVTAAARTTGMTEYRDKVLTK
jgi:DNA modification methylase